MARRLVVDIGLILFFLIGMGTIFAVHRWTSSEDRLRSLRTIEVSIINNVMEKLKPDDILGELATQKQLLAQGNAQLAELNAQIDLANEKLDALTRAVIVAEEALEAAEAEN